MVSTENSLESATWNTTVSYVCITMEIVSEPPNVTLFALGASLRYVILNTTTTLSPRESLNVYLMDMLPLNALVAVNTSVVSDVPETLTLIELSFSTPSNTLFAELRSVGITR